MNINVQTTPTDPAALARRPDTAGPLAVATPTTRRAVDVQGVVADRFLGGALADALAARRYPPVEWRTSMWSTVTEDLASFRRAVADGPLSVAQECRALATLGMSEAEVERDTSGNARLHKRDWRKRDDVAASLLLASGAVRRWPIATPFAMASL